MRVVILLALVGCTFEVRVPNMPDEAGLGTEPGTDCAWSFMPRDFDPCMIAAPAAPPSLFTGTYIIESDTGMMRGAGGPFQLPYKVVNGIGVVSLTELVLQSSVNIRAEGMKPLVIAVFGSAQVGGSIDVSSNTGNTGAGANPTTCGTSFGGNGVAVASGDGGGGGGGFGALGGLGGNGAGVAASGGAVGMSRVLPQTLEGGCRGGNAPAGDGGTPGRAGNGGGGIALVVKNTLSISGIVHAGGAGGTGGAQSQTGGGGGGSGGMIRLEASALDLATSAILAANGGQGGGGCDNSAATAGASGVAGVTEAAQANNQGAGTAGGGGGHLARSTGNAAAQSSDGGGGGGGGVGYIVYKGHASATGIGGATSSPAAQPF
ncbi:MAG: hypothetical protein M4D80_10510 [Myxococcota bacterium]|nr:hypothetical protein [Deltaproteobacteria bacterium]MDQ3335587.1 hypothetical protein [Myxococcota bacterium]